MDSISGIVADPVDSQKTNEYSRDNASGSSERNTVDHPEEKEAESEQTLNLLERGSTEKNARVNAKYNVNPSAEGRKEEVFQESDKKTNEVETKLQHRNASKNESGTGNGSNNSQEPTTESKCREEHANFVQTGLEAVILGRDSPANTYSEAERDENTKSGNVNTEDNTAPDAGRRSGDSQKQSECEKPDIGDSQEYLEQMESGEHGGEGESDNMDVDEEPGLVDGVVREPKLTAKQMSDSSSDEDDHWSRPWASRDTQSYRAGYPVSLCVYIVLFV